MDTGTLTPRSADVVADCRFTGNFGQPDGFGSVLTALVRRDGGTCLTLAYRSDPSVWTGDQRTWSVELTNEQRKHLAVLLLSYDPVLWEPINHPTNVQPPAASAINPNADRQSAD